MSYNSQVYIARSFFDKFGTWLNRRQLLKHLSKTRGIVVEIGCGIHAANLRAVASRFQLAVGIDFHLSQSDPQSNISLISGDAAALFAGFPDSVFDTILLINVLEHLEQPILLLNNIHRTLRPDGIVIINVPTWLGKILLEFLAFRLRQISSFSINDHKRYYSSSDLWLQIRSAGFMPQDISVRYHKFFMNSFAVARKALTQS